MSIERYSHVMHIGSTVKGQLRKDKTAVDAIDSVLPAGRVPASGKVRTSPSSTFTRVSGDAPEISTSSLEK